MLKKRHFLSQKRQKWLVFRFGFAKYNFVHYRKLGAFGVMAIYNTKFELSVDDIDRIEGALRASKLQLTQEQFAKRANVEDELRDISELLGRLHNQKTFYRPRKGTYVSA